MSAQPLVSIVLIAYNQERFIRAAIESVLNQTYSPLEIILSDDASPDKTFEIIQEIATSYRGPHKIVLNRNERNLGITMHFNRVMELVSGEIVALAAGDDISLKDRIADSVRILTQYPDLSCISLKCITFYNDPPREPPPHPSPEQIHFVDLNYYLNNDGGYISAPSRAFRRYTHDYFGPITPSAPSEDTANLFRCLLHAKGAEISTVGVLYRVHGNNTWSSANKFKTSLPNLYQELESTLRTALYKGLIDIETCFSLHKKVKRRLGKLSVIMELERSKFTFYAFVMLYLTSKHFTLRQKAGRFYRSLRSLEWK